MPDPRRTTWLDVGQRISAALVDGKWMAGSIVDGEWRPDPEGQALIDGEE